MNQNDYKFIIANGYGALPKTELELKESHHLWIDSIVYGGDKSEFHKIIDATSIPERGDKYYMKGIGRGKNIRYISYFYKMLEQYREISNHLIIEMDVTGAVSDLRWNIEKALAGTDFKPPLPPDDRYPRNASIHYDHPGSSDSGGMSSVLKDYVVELSRCGLDLIRFESYGDDFIFYIHQRSTPLAWSKTALIFRSYCFYKDK